MNRQDGHLQFDTNKRNNLISYAHGQLCLEQANSLNELMMLISTTLSNI
jgi:hypothetical protein